MRCEFENLGHDLYRCKKCGLKIRTHDASKIYVICPGQPRKKSEYPPLLKQAKNYATALAKHTLSGGATCDDTEVQARLAVCRSCEKYNAADERCTVCGCRANADANAFTNKLRMKSQKCPLEKWS